MPKEDDLLNSILISLVCGFDMSLTPKTLKINVVFKLAHLNYFWLDMVDCAAIHAHHFRNCSVIQSQRQDVVYTGSGIYIQ